MTPAEARIRLWREDPRGILRFVDEQFRVKLDRWQEEALVAFASPKPEHRRISLQACVGPGKSAVLAWCGLWFLGCCGGPTPGQHPKGLATSITGDNLRDNLWAEYAKWMGLSPYLSQLYVWTASRIFAKQHEKTWFIGARTWPKVSNADEQGKTFSGLHSEYVMAQIDESGAIPTTVLRAAEQALSRCVFGKIIQAGNPISHEGMLHAAFDRLRHLWHVIRITGDPADPQSWVNSPRVGDGPRKWAEEQIATYGRDNPWVMSYILGMFPPSSINALLSAEEVEKAMSRVYKGDEYSWAQKRLGVDVARFGDDRTVLFPRQGLYAGKPVVLRNADTVEIATRVAKAVDKWMPDGDGLVLIDDSFAWGHGVIDNLRAWRRKVMGVDYGGKAHDPRYENRRAEMWLSMSEAIKEGTRLPRIESLVAELTTPTYTFTKHGRMVLEDKELVKQRLGRSPDLADALATTWAIPELPKAAIARFQQPHKTRSDFDPWARSEGRRAAADFDPTEL